MEAKGVIVYGRNWEIVGVREFTYSINEFTHLKRMRSKVQIV
jgi:hypothetical protein